MTTEDQGKQVHQEAGVASHGLQPAGADMAQQTRVDVGDQQIREIPETAGVAEPTRLDQESGFDNFEREEPPSVEKIFRLLEEYQRELAFYQRDLELIEATKALLAGDLLVATEEGEDGVTRLSEIQPDDTADVIKRLKQGLSAPFQVELAYGRSHPLVTTVAIDKMVGSRYMTQETKQKLKDQLELLVQDLESTLIIPKYWVAHTEYMLRKAEAAILEQEISSGADSEPHQDILDTITLIKAGKRQRLDTPALLLIREKQLDLGMTLAQIESEARAKVANGGQLSPEEIRQYRVK